MSLYGQITEESIQSALEQMMKEKGRLFPLRPLQKPRYYDPELIKQSSDEVANNAVRSIFASHHDNAKPVFDELQQDIVNKLRKDGADESVIHFASNYSLSSEDVLDLLLELAEEDGGTENG